MSPRSHGSTRKTGSRRSRQRSSITAAVLFLLSGCSALPQQPTLEIRAQFGTVAIVPVREAPASNFATFAKDPVSGAARGAVVGAAPVRSEERRVGKSVDLGGRRII